MKLKDLVLFLIGFFCLWTQPVYANDMSKHDDFIQEDEIDLDIVGFGVGGRIMTGRLVAGDNITISPGIVNLGNTVADNVVVKVYQGDPTVGGVQIGETKYIEHLEPGYPSTGVSVIWQPSMPGEYEIFMVVDPDDSIAETNEHNNQFQTDLQVVSPGIDLRPTGFGFPSDIVIGYETQINSFVQNRGETVAENIAVTLYEGDPDDGGIQIDKPYVIDSIEPERSQPATFTWQPDSIGTHLIYAIVDLANNLEEFDETNNRASREFEVREPGIDLTISAPSALGLVAGNVGKITTYVHNEGELLAENVDIDFYTGDPDSGGVQIGATQVITGIESGQTVGIETSWQPPAQGTYTISVIVDPQNSIQELDETNNGASQEFEVRKANITWYVDASVNQSGDGRTSDTAFRTIAEAISQAYFGDTILLAPGIYYETFEIPSGVEVIGAGYTQTKVNTGPDFFGQWSSILLNDKGAS